MLNCNDLYDEDTPYTFINTHDRTRRIHTADCWLQL